MCRIISVTRYRAKLVRLPSPSVQIPPSVKLYSSIRICSIGAMGTGATHGVPPIVTLILFLTT